MFLFLFPIMLFNAVGEDISENCNKTQLHYMALLEEYLLIEYRFDREIVSKRLGATSEMICYLQ